MAFIFVNEGQSIQAAINAAQPGDTILIGSGTYNESIDINKAGVTLQAFDTGGGPPVIEGPIMGQLGVPDGTPLNDYFEANNPAYSGSTGVTVSANGVTIQGITITGWSTGMNIGSCDGVTISNNTFVDNVTGINKGTEANVTDITINNNSFSQGVHGMTIYAAANGNGAFDGVVMNGNDFSELSEKGMYFEQLSNATLTGNVFDDVGNFGRISPPFGGTQGEFGQAIDINLKYETYENVTFTNTTITNSGNSNQDGEGPTGVFGAAIGVKTRDDGPSYSGAPADFDGAIVFDGLTIDGTSMGVRVGEPGKNNFGPDVTLTNVTITNATVGEVENDTHPTSGGTVNVGIGATVASFDASASQADVDVTGNTLDNTIATGGGQDSINGGAGADSLDGGGGSDVLNGGEGNDNLEGGAGTDTAVYSEAISISQLTANGATWTVVASPPEAFNEFSSASPGSGTDTLSGVEIVQSSSGNILLVGSGGFATIQEAVDAAQAGDIIMVAAGDYEETVVVDVDVTILGANHGVAGNGERGDESIVTGGFLITADGVTIDGFEISGGVPPGLFGGDRPYGVFITGDNATVINNEFAGGNAGDARPFGAGGTASGFDFSNNYVHDWQQGAYIVNGAAGAIHDNQFIDNGNGIVTESLLTVIHDNSFDGSTGADVAPLPYDDVNINSIVYGNTYSDGKERPITVYLNGPNGQSVVGSNTSTTYRVDYHNGSATILAGTGADTLSWADASQAVTADLAAGTSSAPFGIVNFTGIENVTGGSASDTLAGSTGANELRGGAGQDTLSGLGGVDTLYGGHDDDTLNGGGDNDSLFGDAGNDTLNGGSGLDAMAGGDGNDTYIVDAAGDAISEAEDEGTDLVQSSVTYTLAANVENLTLTGLGAINGTGNNIANILTGNAAANTLSGLAGADFITAGAGLDTLFGGDGDDLLEGGDDADYLDGGNDHDTLNGGAAGDSLFGRAGNDTLNGGAGADAMQGGAGDDVYVVDDAGDSVTEAAGAGNDTVQSSITYGLGAFVENLTLTGGSAINGVGNILANVITGNNAANTVTGGAGGDTLFGNGGNDALFGGNGEDVIDGGDDDDLLDGGNDADTLDGGNGVDTLYGRTADDVLNGGAGDDTAYGGDGNDTIDGGEGNDLLDGLNNDDVIDGGDGDDEIYGRQNNDSLNGGAGNDDLYGGDGDDTMNGGADDDLMDGGNGVDIMSGGDGADTLYGRNGNDVLNGGLGADTLFGGNDQDTFVFSSALGGGNIDSILNFSVVDDVIHLDIAVFSGIGLGGLDIDAFIVGTAAADAEDRIIYDSVTGALYYDADGVGGASAVQFASLSPGLGLTSADFFGIPGGGP